MNHTRELAAIRGEAAAKAAVLIESLPWMQRFAGKIMVIKFGGNAMVSPELLRSFAEDVVYLRHAGIRPVIVHGGGPQITRMLDRLQLRSEFQAGYRRTTPEVMDVVRMVLTGQVNPQLVDAINRHGPFAIGVSGEDAGLFAAERRAPFERDGERIDLGLVGDIVSVRPEAVLAMTERGLIPVVSSIAPERPRRSRDTPATAHAAETPRAAAAGEPAAESAAGTSLNINADAAAAALATALDAEKLVLLTDVPGLYANWPDTSQIISSLTLTELDELLPSLASGMIPKLTACRDAVRHGVAKAAIIDGREPHSVLLEIFTASGVGTEVVADTTPAPTTRSIPVQR